MIFSLKRCCYDDNVFLVFDDNVFQLTLEERRKRRNLSTKFPTLHDMMHEHKCARQKRQERNELWHWTLSVCPSVAVDWLFWLSKGEEDRHIDFGRNILILSHDDYCHLEKGKDQSTAQVANEPRESAGQENVLRSFLVHFNVEGDRERGKKIMWSCLEYTFRYS